MKKAGLLLGMLVSVAVGGLVNLLLPVPGLGGGLLYPSSPCHNGVLLLSRPSIRPRPMARTAGHRHRKRSRYCVPAPLSVAVFGEDGRDQKHDCGSCLPAVFRVRPLLFDGEGRPAALLFSQLCGLGGKGCPPGHCPGLYAGGFHLWICLGKKKQAGHGTERSQHTE